MRRVSVYYIRAVLRILEEKKKPDRAVVKPQYPPRHADCISHPPKYPFASDESPKPPQELLMTHNLRPRFPMGQK